MKKLLKSQVKGIKQSQSYPKISSLAGSALSKQLNFGGYIVRTAGGLSRLIFVRYSL